jgi:hypothetical protein
MAAFAAGAMIEQRYPGASEVDARGLAAPQLAAFAAAGWTVLRDAWRPASVADAPAGAPPPVAVSGAGTLVVTLRAERDADLPLRLAVGLDAPERRSPPSPYVIRVVVLLVAGVLLIVLFAYLANQAGAPLPPPAVVSLSS